MCPEEQTKAVEELKEAGFEAYAKSCDTSKRESVKALAEYAASLGEIINVIHAAGVSPAMNVTMEDILRINALGTVYVNQEFAKLMHKGSVIIDIASMSAYAMPELMLPKKAYPLAETDEALFIKKVLKMTGMIKDEYQKKGLAYSVSKNFVTWYAAKCAFDFGPRGIRVASLSPGLIATDMGNLESEHGGSMLATSCEERMGTPEELGFAVAKTGESGIINDGEMTSQEIAARYRKPDGTSLLSKEFSAMPVEIQREAMRGYDKAISMYGNIPPQRIKAERMKKTVYASYSLSYNTITLNSAIPDAAKGAYATVIHEMTHHAENIGLFESDEILQAAFKRLALRSNSNQAANLKIRTVGSTDKKDYGNVQEIIAHAMDKQMTGKGNQLTDAIYEVLKEKGVIK